MTSYDDYIDDNLVSLLNNVQLNDSEDGEGVDDLTNMAMKLSLLDRIDITDETIPVKDRLLALRYGDEYPDIPITSSLLNAVMEELEVFYWYPESLSVISRQIALKLRFRYDDCSFYKPMMVRMHWMVYQFVKNRGIAEYYSGYSDVTEEQTGERASVNPSFIRNWQEATKNVLEDHIMRVHVRPPYKVDGTGFPVADRMLAKIDDDITYHVLNNMPYLHSDMVEAAREYTVVEPVTRKYIEVVDRYFATIQFLYMYRVYRELGKTPLSDCTDKGSITVEGVDFTGDYKVDSFILSYM